MPGLNVYTSPGCGDQTPAPACLNVGGACIHYACSCNGEVIQGCNEFSQPYARLLGLQIGDACDPTIGAGGADGGWGAAGGGGG